VYLEYVYEECTLPALLSMSGLQNVQAVCRVIAMKLPLRIVFPSKSVSRAHSCIWLKTTTSGYLFTVLFPFICPQMPGGELLDAQNPFTNGSECNGFKASSSQQNKVPIMYL
jgi:hypothetical protein